jgi:hypothetical protein
MMSTATGKQQASNCQLQFDWVSCEQITNNHGCYPCNKSGIANFQEPQQLFKSGGSH